MNLDYYRIEKALKFIDENLDNQPTLEQISSYVGLDKFYFQKMFTKWAGISPKKFLQFLNIENAKRVLNESTSNLKVSNEIGLSSTSRLHDLFIKIESMSPKEYKKQAKDMQIDYGFHESHFGKVLIASTKKGLCGIHFVIDDETSATEILKNDWPEANFVRNQKSSEIYFKKIFGKNGSKDIKLILKGTEFQIKVWRALLSIPEGSLVTYMDVAKKINNPNANRAVGTAIGTNPISYLIPCHRVINKIGKIGNYRWGGYRKKAMIGFELAG